ncbi:hypothetical protein EAE99_012317 [Botrytis elliptica]|nr:hypothetical protein EAE99_012317 [Botrytis elliptica]
MSQGEQIKDSDHVAVPTSEKQASSDSQESSDVEKKASFTTPDGIVEDTSFVYMTGWRLHLMRLCCAISMFLVNMEVSIIGTSLISITNDLRGFSQMGWVVTGYLITYTGLLIIWAKISDIYGRKPAMIISMLIFTVFSGGCGAAHTMMQLIVCRVFQGVGAAGAVSLALVAAYEMVPKDKYPLQAALIGSAIALGSLVGPLIGGGVSEHSTWRWVFLINVPVGVVCAALLYISVPSNFPYHGRPVLPHPITNSLSRLDISGASLLLGATVLLVTVLLEAGIEFAWKSGTAIALIILSGILFVAFMLNEKVVSKEKRTQEAVFPFRFLSNRPWMGTLLMSFLSGIPYNIIVIDIPQRFQAIDSISPFTSGLRLIPFNFSISLSSILVNIIAKQRVPPIILLFIGSIIQLVGMSLFSTLPENGTLPNTIYGWEVLTGFGMGWVMGICLLLPPAVVEGRDLAISGGSLLQFRVLGGVLGLAISTAIMNNHLTSHLTPLLGAEQLSLLLQSTREIENLSEELRIETVKAFAYGYNMQMKVNVAFSVVQVLIVGVMWTRNGKGWRGQIEVVEKQILKE